MICTNTGALGCPALLIGELRFVSPRSVLPHCALGPQIARSLRGYKCALARHGMWVPATQPVLQDLRAEPVWGAVGLLWKPKGSGHFPRKISCACNTPAPCPPRRGACANQRERERERLGRRPRVLPGYFAAATGITLNLLPNFLCLA